MQPSLPAASLLDSSLLLPSDELPRLAARHPRLALEILAHPGLSLRGLESILAGLLPFGPRPAHALAAASNPALPLLFMVDPRALVPIWRQLLDLGQGALVGALHIARQLPWSARHELDAFARSLPRDRFARRHALALPSPGPDPTPLEALVPRLWRRDIRFRTAHAILAHVETSETLDGFHLGGSLFHTLAPLGVTPPALWQRMAQTV